MSQYAQALSRCRAEEFADLFVPETGYFASGFRGRMVGRERLIALVRERAAMHCAPRCDPGPAPGRSGRADGGAQCDSQRCTWRRKPWLRRVSGRIREDASGLAVRVPHRDHRSREGGWSGRARHARDSAIRRREARRPLRRRSERSAAIDDLGSKTDASRAFTSPGERISRTAGTTTRSMRRSAPASGASSRASTCPKGLRKVVWPLHRAPMTVFLASQRWRVKAVIRRLQLESRVSAWVTCPMVGLID